MRKTYFVAPKWGIDLYTRSTNIWVNTVYITVNKVQHQIMMAVRDFSLEIFLGKGTHILMTRSSQYFVWIKGIRESFSNLDLNEI